jgi:nitroimidazol reductase NimA-like FMN-containing flavoprotein (pyridoxamine 5'-phosphate oxidase superfamily)
MEKQNHMPNELKDRIRALLASHQVCVLATVEKDRPYCSLMNYITDETCRDFYMVTQKDSNKYRNLLSNPQVSVLVDSREKTPSATSWALTIEGVFEPVSDGKRRKWAITRLISVNPSLNEFISLPDVEVVCIRARSFLLLTGISDVHYLTVV